MSYDPVEGLHYIFDRYAFINKIMEDGGQSLRINEASEKADIEKAINHARAMYHPDRQARTGEEMRLKAEQKTLLIVDCARFLLNADLKPVYDAKLAEFRDTKPGMVSDSGMAIISLAETFFDISSLLSDKVVDTADFELRVRQMLQYDENRVLQAQQLYDMLPANPQVQAVYRDALTQEYTYLTLLEDSAWAKVGYMNRKEKEPGFLARPADYTKRIEASLQAAADRDIDSTIEKRSALALLGMAKMPVLLEAKQEDGDATAEANPDAQLQLKDHARLVEQFKTVARKNFNIRADYVREVAERKQKTLEKLCILTPTETLQAEAPGQTVFDFILANPVDDGKQQVLFRMTLDVTTGDAAIGETYSAGTTLQSLKDKGFARGTFALTRNPEITDLLVEAGAACERFMDAREAAEKAAKPESATKKTKVKKPKAAPKP
ncbi:MAG: hypothetical protein PW788_10600 [Micavibrio sp.]|nr:hypothetical protein [Micavibrio sp.]